MRRVFDFDKNKLKVVGFLTREEVRKAAEILSTPVNREDSQICSKYCGAWIDLLYPVSNWELNKYRIKSELKYRPFKDVEECFKEMKKYEPFGWIKSKSSGCYMCIGMVDTKGVCFGPNYQCTYYDAFYSYTFVDGEPFGIKED